ncbi:MAG: four helix bundle protein [Ignavibacteriaceae bacterium]|jgi:four helix bundle protein|nr:four helix bundle protein [Ignavibacteriaceae bacterium]
MKLSELEVFNLAMELGEMVWKEVLAWDYFAKNTIGKQVVNSADSVAANIAEGFGRFHYQENKHFCYISRGSLTETQVWLKKAENRNLITIEVLQIYNDKIDLLHKRLNAYIKSIGSKNITNK